MSYLCISFCVCIQIFLLKERIKIVGDKGDKTVAKED